MEKLIFKYGQRMLIPNTSQLPVDEKEIGLEKERLSNIYKNFIGRINKDGGFIELFIDNSGKKVIQHKLWCSTELSDSMGL